MINFSNAKSVVDYDPLIMNNLGSSYYMTQRFDSAKYTFTEMKKIFNNYIEPQVNLLAIYTNQKNIDSAKMLINEIDAHKFDNATVKNYTIFIKIKDYLK